MCEKRCAHFIKISQSIILCVLFERQQSTNQALQGIPTVNRTQILHRELQLVTTVVVLLCRVTDNPVLLLL